MPPLNSVIIPTFNRAAWVREAVDSVLAQTFQDNELIVVDNGSADIPGKSSFLRGSPEHYFPGPAGSRRRPEPGSGDAAGEWAAFLDRDRLWLPRNWKPRSISLTSNPRRISPCATNLPGLGKAAG